MSVLGAANATGSTLLIALFALAFAFFGYRMSVRHHTQRGVTPWRFPSIVWALICFAIGPLGILVELFAGVTTRPSGVPEGAVDVTSQRPDPRVGFDVRPASTIAVAKIDPAAPLEGVLGDVRTGPPQPRGADGTMPGPFGWYPDVTGRHEYRYFDGKYWGEQVADGGVTSRDPL